MKPTSECQKVCQVIRLDTVLAFVGQKCHNNIAIGVGTGGGGLGPLTFLFEGAQYSRGPLTFEKCRPTFELKVTPYWAYFQS